jgi:hypothetical protein
MCTPSFIGATGQRKKNNKSYSPEKEKYSSLLSLSILFSFSLTKARYQLVRDSTFRKNKRIAPLGFMVYF